MLDAKRSHSLVDKLLSFFACLQLDTSSFLLNKKQPGSISTATTIFYACNHFIKISVRSSGLLNKTPTKNKNNLLKVNYRCFLTISGTFTAYLKLATLSFSLRRWPINLTDKKATFSAGHDGIKGKHVLENKTNFHLNC